MKDTLKRLQDLSSLNIKFDEQRDQLLPFVELAKYITDSPACEINIVDAYNQWTIAQTQEITKVIPRDKSICQDTITKNGAYEIENLKQHNRYKDRFYVSGEPYFQYYCGVQLTTSSGRNIGSICVLDTKSKTISKSQKEQLQRLADLIINHLESEHRYNNLSSKFNNQKDTLRKLNHDVRSPINGVLGIAETLGDDNKEQLTVPGQDIKLIKQAAKAIIDKIDGVLSNLEPGGQSENEKETTLHQTLDKIDNLYRPLAQGKQQNLSFQNNAESSIVIPEYLSIKLTQIIGNLVANAIKFTPKEGSIKVTIDQQENDTRKSLTFTVDDHGKGMNAEQVTSFNNENAVQQSEGTEGERSFGVGLMHVQQLVSGLKGNISVNSEINKGTTFSISIPLSH